MQEGVCTIELVSKHRLNTKSTTESEVVSVSEYVPYKMYMICFGQGYALHKKVLYQYNRIAMNMKKNGRNLCTDNSRQISIRYFFVKDRVDKEKFSIEYCNKLAMLADYCTKPLQG